MSTKFYSLDDVNLIVFPSFADETGELVPVEANTGLPIDIARVFTVRATDAGARRGQHAHRVCNQVVLCVAGSADVVCDDGTRTRQFRLSEMSTGVFIPASIWAEQIYLEPQSCLMVLCDRPYEEEDYIRDYAGFLEFRGISTGVTDAT